MGTLLLHRQVDLCVLTSALILSLACPHHHFILVSFLHHLPMVGHILALS